jgi:hypothetical protein
VPHSSLNEFVSEKVHSRSRLRQSPASLVRRSSSAANPKRLGFTNYEGWEVETTSELPSPGSDRLQRQQLCRFSCSGVASPEAANRHERLGHQRVGTRGQERLRHPADSCLLNGRVIKEPQTEKPQMAYGVSESAYWGFGPPRPPAPRSPQLSTRAESSPSPRGSPRQGCSPKPTSPGTPKAAP